MVRFKEILCWASAVGCVLGAAVCMVFGFQPPPDGLPNYWSAVASLGYTMMASGLVMAAAAFLKTAAAHRRSIASRRPTKVVKFNSEGRAPVGR